MGPLSFERVIVFHGDRVAAERRLGETVRVIAEFAPDLTFSATAVSERSACLAALEEPGSALLIADVYAADVASGPNGARLMRAVAQHAVVGQTTRRLLTHHTTQSIPRWSHEWVHATFAWDMWDAAVYRQGLAQVLSDGGGEDALVDGRVDIADQLRHIGRIPVAAHDVETAIAVFERATGVNRSGGGGGESKPSASCSDG